MSDNLEKADVSDLLAKVTTTKVVPESATPLTPVSELIEVIPPKTDSPVSTASDIADILNETAGSASAQPLSQPELAPFQKKERYKLEDYVSLDWNKSNAELAKETGKTEVYMSQVRWKVKAFKATGDNGRKPDFSDILPTTEKAAIDYQLMSGTLFDMSTGTLSMVLGPEWQPKDAQERDVMIMSLKAYLTAKQVQDLPPGVILAFVCCAYAAPRFRAPATAEKLRFGWRWIKEKLSKLRRKKPPILTVVQKRELDQNVENGK